MIVGLGVDVVDLGRFERVVRRWGERFLRRVFSRSELDLSGGKVEFLAGRFAAKEAYLKALGFGMWKVPFNSIEVLREKGGKPFIVVEGKLPDFKVHVSIAHERGVAVSVVVVEDGGYP